MGGNFQKRSKRKRRNNERLDLEGKVAEAGGEGCFGLEVSSSGDENENIDSTEDSGVYGSKRSVASRSTHSRARRFLSSARSHAQAPSIGQASMVSSKRNPYKSSSSRLRRSSALGSSLRSTSNSRPRVGVANAAVHIVCAIGENLARETCVASLDAGTPVFLQVTKQGNGQTYAETLAYLEMLRPDEVLLNEGRRSSPLARKILQLYDGNQDAASKEGGANKEDPSSSSPCRTSTVVKFISRSCFDQTKGAEMLRRLARDETYDATLVEEYILLSSSHAVLHYTQHTLGASFSRSCLDISINSGGKNRMAIDRSTLLQLELLTNAKTGKTRNSLVSTIDCTKTTVGSRLLRTNLMAPPCRIDTINARLDLVDTFLEDEEFFYAVLEHLQNLPAVDKMLTNIAIIPRKVWKSRNGTKEAPVVTSRLASKGISALVCIKSMLTALPALATILSEHLAHIESGDDVEGANGNGNSDASAITGRSSLLIGLGGGPASAATPQRHHLLRAIIHAITQPQLAQVKERVSDIFTESTSFSRNANAMRHQECFALKSQDDGMMDILRKAFLANVDDIYQKADEYAEIHGIHVSVRYSTSRGYYLSVPAEIASGLPNIFIQPAKSGNHIHCTTEEVHSLNIRAQDNVQDLLLMTHERIQEVLEDARSKYDALASLSDAVALLDLCHSFADKVTLSKLPWSRPVMAGQPDRSDTSGGKASAITIRNGRYGIDVTDSYLASADGPREIIPNDTYASGLKNFTVISGINGSGKSTYLKQIAIIVLLAHCGSYVPAEQASIPLRTRLCARMGTADDQENNISSFMLEMKETAFICNNASDGSLLLLDELGRATSNEDGVAIAWAVSEFLLSKHSITFFVTHYPHLCRLGDVYPAVQNQHLKASVSADGNGEIHYTHKVSEGPCTVTPDYGVEMATSCGWPADVVESARLIEFALQDKLSQNDFCTTHRPSGAADSLISFYSKVTLKKLSRQMVEAVQAESSIGSLRTTLERLKATAFQNSRVSMSIVKDVLDGLISCDDDQVLGLSHITSESCNSGISDKIEEQRYENGSEKTTVDGVRTTDKSETNEIVTRVSPGDGVSMEENPSLSTLDSLSGSNLTDSSDDSSDGEFL